jgi:hypothetical protein
MCVAPVVNMSVFFVSYCGVVTSFIGPSAHCLAGAVLAIMYGDLVRSSPTRIVAMAKKTWSILGIGTTESLRRWSLQWTTRVGGFELHQSVGARGEGGVLMKRSRLIGRFH